MSLFHLSSTKNSESTQEKTVAMDHQQPGWVHSHKSSPDATFRNADTNDTADDFFSRPVKIATFDWPINSDFFVSLDPWEAFWENPRVSNKLSNFKKMRCDMVVDILVNGNPFYYGSMIASMNLLPNYDQQTVFRPGEQADIVNASQRPHIYLDPTRSEGGQIYVPYFYPKDAIDIPLGEWRQMGRLNMASIVPLQHAAGATESITITVLAYCKNVHISTPTNQPPGFLRPQSGGDEAEFGLISGPSSAIARASGMLANIPIIRPYALAVEMGASTVSKIAKLFGFSRPICTSEPEAFTSRPAGTLAVTNVSSNAVPLSFDIKKQVTVDPRTAGMSSEDEMAILPLAMRESFVTTFPWSRASPPDSHLFSICCTPMHGQNLGTELHITPSAWIATPFRYWKGTLQFRFKIVASNFHRGRLRFAWDPDHISNLTEFNTNYSDIVDITNMTDITLTIGWGQTTAYLSHNGPLSVPNYSRVEFGSQQPFCNGILSVFVVNELTAPADASPDIDILVFQSAGDDFEVACPDSRYMELVQPTSFPDNPGDEGGDTDGDGGGGSPGDLPDAEMIRMPAATVLLGRSTATDPTVVEPQHNDLNNLQNSVNLTNNTLLEFDLQYFRLAVGSVLTAPVIFEFSNPASQTLPITVTVNGNDYTETLPGNIGATVSITTEPLDMGTALGVFATTPISINSTGGFSRFRLDRITLPMPAGAQSVRLEPNDLLNINIVTPSDPIKKVFVDNGRANQTGLEQSALFPIPADLAPGSSMVVAATSSIDIDGINFDNTTRRNPNNAMLAPFEPTGSNFEFLNSQVSGLATPFEVLRVYYISVPGSPQAGDGDPMDSLPSETGAPQHEDEHITMGPVVSPAEINLVHFGETVTSLRQVMKRHESWFNIRIIASEGRATFRFPLRYTSGFIDPNITTTTVPVFHWFMLGFLGERGSKRVFMNNVCNVPTICSLSRLNVDDYFFGVTSVGGTNFPVETRWDGTAMTNSVTNSFLQCEIPWYSQYRFGTPRAENSFDFTDVIASDYGRADFSPQQTSGIRVQASFAVAAGDDYSLFHFHGTPVFVRIA